MTLSPCLSVNHAPPRHPLGGQGPTAGGRTPARDPRFMATPRRRTGRREGVDEAPARGAVGRCPAALARLWSGRGVAPDREAHLP